MNEPNMTGAEFLDWLHGVKQIEKVEWQVRGEPLDAEAVSVIITADGDQITIYFGSPKRGERPNEFQKTLLCLIGNRIFPDQEPFNIFCDPTEVVNCSIQRLEQKNLEPIIKEGGKI